MFGAILAILYLNIKSKKENRADETNEIANLNAEIIRLKDSLNSTINTSLSSMSTSFNSLSTGVTKDMTEALTKVDEKVGNFNEQVKQITDGLVVDFIYQGFNKQYSLWKPVNIDWYKTYNLLLELINNIDNL